MAWTGLRYQELESTRYLNRPLKFLIFFGYGTSNTRLTRTHRGPVTIKNLQRVDYDYTGKTFGVNFPNKFVGQRLTYSRNGVLRPPKEHKTTPTGQLRTGNLTSNRGRHPTDLILGVTRDEGP